ncbi:hybrid sensor histidine kinase/response regulator [Herbaspirillum huttiense F1]|jgi:Chemotaxis protein histidine kinase and related kinases|uniref:hybrid sensor histidine kinase/response regulator n=1 Tax=Herbaspirillum TaxID=963 RepID=UPI000EB01A6B|nr:MULTISPECIES: hybrid sensor histidine kinase/response regulator [Herbaspirillum]MBP1314077.1 two-component system sensor histidine kinase and response regulator WspE [Herbaspirillum sp. 1130]MDT0354648.1 hybrid sensor histidine kinase/response regulator [Herbaspirillum huttiense F1]
MSTPDLSQMSMLDLFRFEAESQIAQLNTSLLALEQQPTAAEHLEACMRAGHSLKGAARIVGLEAAVKVAHVLEDCFVLAQQGKLRLEKKHIDVLLRGADLLGRIASPPDGDETWVDHAGSPEVQAFLQALPAVMSGADADPWPAPSAALQEAFAAEAAAQPPAPAPSAVVTEPPQSGASAPIVNQTAAARAVRVSADSLDRLLSLTGESLVESRRLKPFSASMLRMKRVQREAVQALDLLQQKLAASQLDEFAQTTLAELRALMQTNQQLLGEQLIALDAFDRRSVNLSQQLYDEALACRMRPFADGTAGFARMVRDVGNALGKSVRLDISGTATQIDRDILEKLEAPLGHLLRNAVDHGIEDGSTRRAAGKPEQGVVRLEARHSAGMLLIEVADDGAGIDLDALRRTVVARGLATQDIAERLSDAELLDFLLLPSFSLRETVTEISGRGVGLDVVADMLKQVRGTIRITTRPGQGSRFLLQLPLTLSVIRSLLVEIAGEPYAFPLAYVNRTLRLPAEALQTLEGYQHFSHGGRQVGLVSAHQVLQRGQWRVRDGSVCVVVIGEEEHSYGIAVDAFLGERMLVVQPLDARLGKIPDILAGALMEDGAPLLILDVADLLRTVEKLTASGRLQTVDADPAGAAAVAVRKKVLVVDDSLTVRELERKLLTNRGYQVTVAVDGMDGWNAVRAEHFDLVITDIDMPRMDGIELVTLIRGAPQLQALPVMIVSYKDREEDRQRGLAAGADHYFTKSSFHDESLLQAVMDLIGEATT